MVFSRREGEQCGVAERQLTLSISSMFLFYFGRKGGDLKQYGKTFILSKAG